MLMSLRFFARTEVQGGEMATASKVTVPKQGDRVSITHQEGVFEVVGFNVLMQTANIRLVDGSGHVIPNVTWAALKVLDKKSSKCLTEVIASLLLQYFRWFVPCWLSTLESRHQSSE
jgi:hypothetical protein